MKILKENSRIVRLLIAVAEAEPTRLSAILSIVIIIVTILQLLMIAVIPVEATQNPTEIYVRIGSSIAALMILGQFFYRYHCEHLYLNNSFRPMLILKIVTIAAAIAGCVKVAISIYYGIVCLGFKNLIGLYYVGEIIMWGLITLFMFAYYRQLSQRRRTN